MLKQGWAGEVGQGNMRSRTRLGLAGGRFEEPEKQCCLLKNMSVGLASSPCLSFFVYRELVN